MTRYTYVLASICFTCAYVVGLTSAECTPECTNGVCVNDVCYCNDNHGGGNCTQQCTTPPCGDGKVCVGTDNCIACDAACDTPYGECKSQGTTAPYDEATCKCNTGYTGANCKNCSSDAGCNNKGTCQSGVCQCNAGSGGEYCQFTCDTAVCKKGECADGVCWCNHGNGGENCTDECAVECDAGKACTGTTCEACTDTCEAVYQVCASRGNGDLMADPECRCSEGYGGTDCHNCSSDVVCKHNGTCVSEMCECDRNYGGMYCEMECVGGCGDLQMCDKHNETAAECVCLGGLSGEDCMNVTCDGDMPCMNSGECADAACECMPRYTGVICEKQCPDECTEDQHCKETDGSLACQDNGASGLVGSCHVLCLLVLAVLALYRD